MAKKVIPVFWDSADILRLLSGNAVVISSEPCDRLTSTAKLVIQEPRFYLENEGVGGNYEAWFIRDASTNAREIVACFYVRDHPAARERAEAECAWLNEHYGEIEE